MIRTCVAKADNGLDVMLNDIFLQKFRKGIVVVVKNNGMSLSGRIKIVVACIKVEFMYSFTVFSQPVGKAQKKIADRALKQQDIFLRFQAGFAGCFGGRAVSCRNVVLFFYVIVLG